MLGMVRYPHTRECIVDGRLLMRDLKGRRSRHRHPSRSGWADNDSEPSEGSPQRKDRGCKTGESPVPGHTVSNHPNVYCTSRCLASQLTLP
jgi:hypothetical protein